MATKKKKGGAASAATKKMAGKRGTIATARRSGSSKAMKAARLAALNAGRKTIAGHIGGGKGAEIE